MKKISRINKKITVSNDFNLNEEEITISYNDKQNIYEALRDEIVFVLRERIDERSIKIHTIESRVKQLPSLLDKCIRKSTNEPFLNFVDISAARVICLFRSDIDKLKEIVSESFEVISVDDKIERESDPLNYLSVHFICKMRPDYVGPRYEKIVDLKFEIQLRTLCMHCWATVSHYVDYKGDWDVPANLKMALSALSGLFYVADNEFESFNTAMITSKTEAFGMEIDIQEINFDTVTSLLRRLYPERQTASVDTMSAFVQEVKAAGYISLRQLQIDVEKGGEYLVRSEMKLDTGGMYFVDVGAARVSLEFISPRFKTVRQEETKKMIKKKPA